MDKNFWLKEPEKHDFTAAFDYLTLHFNDKDAAKMVEELKKSETVIRKAKDILRASRLPLLDKSNIHVKEDLKKIKNGKKLSPILLVRNMEQLIVADGYHRVCSIYQLSEDLEVPCRLV